jgi:hypothetical protein
MVSLLVCLAAPSVSRAATLIVLPASGANLSATLIQSVRQMLVQRLGRPDRYSVIDFDRPPTPWPPHPLHAAHFARAMGAKVAVVLHIVHTERNTQFQVTCYAADGRRLCHIDEVVTAGPEILEQVAERLATRTVEELSPHSSSGLRRLAPPPARREPRDWGLGLRLGTVVPVASAGGRTIVMPGGGGFVMIDRRSYVGELFFEAARQGEGSALGGGLGAHVPLADGGTAPYLGGRVKWTRIRLGGRGASGISVEPILGMWWDRFSALRLRLEVGYFVDLFEERELDRLIVGSGEGHRSHGVQLSMGVAF